MRFLSWLDGLKPVSSRRQTKRGQPRSPRRKPAGCKLSVEILEDRSMPSFLAPVSYSLVPYDPRAMVTADFNGDGRLDLAVANFYSSNVSVLLSNADGTFQPARTSANGTYQNSLAVGDFNGDGKLDFATANYDYATVSVLLGDGLGNLEPPTDFATFAASPFSVAAGDVNGDGHIDLVTANNYTSDYGNISSVSVLLGDGLGSFGSPR